MDHTDYMVRFGVLVYLWLFVDLGLYEGYVGSFALQTKIIGLVFFTWVSCHLAFILVKYLVFTTHCLMDSGLLNVLLQQVQYGPTLYFM